MERDDTTPDSAEEKPRLTGMEWVKEKRILLGSAAVATACAAIAVLGQIDYYKSIPHLPSSIAYLFPIGVESISWVFGAAAAKCVQDNLPSAKYSRRMWAFALFAAGVNIWHAVNHINIPVGVVLGLASVFGPFVWHSYTGMARVAKSGKTFEEIKVAAKTKLQHPMLSWRASRIQTLLQCSSSEAWVYALAFKTSDIRKKVKDSMARKLEKAPLAVLTVDGTTADPAKAASKAKAAAAKPAVEQGPKTEVAVKVSGQKPAPAAEIELKPVPPVNLALVRQYGEQRAKSIAIWEARLDENDGRGPSYRSIDIVVSGRYTGTAKGAIPTYIRDHGDPREKRQQNRKDGMG